MGEYVVVDVNRITQETRAEKKIKQQHCKSPYYFFLANELAWQYHHKWFLFWLLDRDCSLVYNLNVYFPPSRHAIAIIKLRPVQSIDDKVHYSLSLVAVYILRLVSFQRC